MNSGRLLWTRVLENGKHKLKTMRAVMDWTIIVYFVIPSIVIGFFIYRSWWLEMPGWIQHIPFSFLFIGSFFLLWNSHFRTYVREADTIFLMKKERLFIGLKKGGILFSYTFEILTAGLLALLIAPFWFQHYGFTGLQLLSFCISWITLKWLVMAVSGRLDVQLRGLISILRNIPLVIGAGAIWYVSFLAFEHGSILLIILISLLNTVGSIVLNYPRFTSIHTFEQDLAIDEREKRKHTEFVLGMSSDIEKLPKLGTVRKNPRLYSKSNRLFKKRTEMVGYLELFIKVTTRNTEYFWGYVRIIGVTVAALIMLPPLWMKIGITACGLFTVVAWSGSIWHKIVGSHPFTKLYSGKDGYFKGKNTVTAVLAVPFTVICLAYFFVIQYVQKSIPLFLNG
ncbi:ABC transporter permease [Siminovitchia sp. FSL W7-1587]|uniref:ABC transporter permease n=1 Tax=Siminovitchia sp. FSL W7-1587 TaxID=2954699 RepID=UPI0030D61E61